MKMKFADVDRMSTEEVCRTVLGVMKPPGRDLRYLLLVAAEGKSPGIMHMRYRAAVRGSAATKSRAMLANAMACGAQTIAPF